MKKLPIIFLMVILLSSFAFAIQRFGIEYPNVVVSADFNNASPFTSYGYSFSDGVGCALAYPYDFTAIGLSQAFGEDNISSCSDNVDMITDFESLDGRIFSEFDYRVSDLKNDAGSTQTIHTMACYDGVQNNVLSVRLNKSYELVTVYNYRTSTSCDISFLLERNTTYTFLLDINENDNTYSLYIDGNSTGCNLQVLGADSGNKCFNRGYWHYLKINGDETGIYFDNFIIASTQTQNETFEAGIPCSDNSECVSGYCFRGVCSLRPYQMECDSDSQCVSGECLNGFCTNPSLFEGIEASKNELFGDDDSSNNLIAISIMIVVAISLIVSGANIKSSALIIIGLLAFYVLGFFFAIVGWLNPFILIAFVLVALIGVAILLVLKGNS